jgi:hypothetical protein
MPRGPTPPPSPPPPPQQQPIHQDVEEEEEDLDESQIPSDRPVLSRSPPVPPVRPNISVYPEEVDEVDEQSWRRPPRIEYFPLPLTSDGEMSGMISVVTAWLRHDLNVSGEILSDLEIAERLDDLVQSGRRCVLNEIHIYYDFEENSLNYCGW